MAEANSINRSVDPYMSVTWAVAKTGNADDGLLSARILPERIPSLDAGQPLARDTKACAPAGFPGVVFL